MDGDGKRVRGDLYDGDFNFGIKQFTFAGKDGENVEVNDLHYIVNSETKSDFTGVSAKMGVGEVKAKELSAQGIVLKEIHYDIGVRHLHAPTLEKIMACLQGHVRQAARPTRWKPTKSCSRPSRSTAWSCSSTTPSSSSTASAS